MRQHGQARTRASKRHSWFAIMRPRTLLLVALLGPALAGCMATPINAGTPARHNASRLPPCHESLARFTAFRLAPFRHARAIQADNDKLAAAAEIEQKLAARLAPVFARWQENAAERTPRRELVLEPFLLRLRVVGTVNRVFSGGYAGDSFIELNLDVRDAGNGELLCSAEVRHGGAAAAGVWTAGSTDRGLVDDVVETTYRYLNRRDLDDRDGAG